jgi:hypothetical protein
LPRRAAWSAPEGRYYTITENGLVLSWSAIGGVIEEEDHSLNTTTTFTVYGVPVIFEFGDEVVYLVGHGTGTSEPTTMEDTLCYVKDVNAGTWAQDTSITANFVPTTRPVQYGDAVYVGGYTQPTDSDDTKTAAVYVWQQGFGWSAVASFASSAGAEVRGLDVLAPYLYALYDDPANAGNAILDRFYGPSTSVTQNVKIFHGQFPSVNLGEQQDGLKAYRGELFTRIYSTATDFDGEGHLWRTNAKDIAGDWILAGVDGIAFTNNPLNQVLNGAPEFVV